MSHAKFANCTKHANVQTMFANAATKNKLAIVSHQVRKCADQVFVVQTCETELLLGRTCKPCLQKTMQNQVCRLAHKVVQYVEHLFCTLSRLGWESCNSACIVEIIFANIANQICKRAHNLQMWKHSSKSFAKTICAKPVKNLVFHRNMDIVH